MGGRAVDRAVEGRAREKSLAKWRSAAREAAKQSRRSVVPDGAPTWPRPRTSSRCSPRRRCGVVLHEAASGPLAASPCPGAGEIVVVVGPEGGITDDELEAFSRRRRRPLRLGAAVLRTSTAGVAAAAALLARTPRWR